MILTESRGQSNEVLVGFNVDVKNMAAGKCVTEKNLGSALSMRFCGSRRCLRGCGSACFPQQRISGSRCHKMACQNFI